jgi:hypothetical protein
MTKQEIIRIAKQSFPNLDIIIKFISKKEMGKDWAACYVVSKNTRKILINRSEFSNAKDKTSMVSTILHELGHVPNDKIKSVGEDEYLAQVWAINKAEELGWKNIKSYLVADILHWNNYGWNQNKGEYRRYILASKIFMKRYVKGEL